MCARCSAFSEWTFLRNVQIFHELLLSKEFNGWVEEKFVIPRIHNRRKGSRHTGYSLLFLRASTAQTLHVGTFFFSFFSSLERSLKVDSRDAPTPLPLLKKFYISLIVHDIQGDSSWIYFLTWNYSAVFPLINILVKIFNKSILLLRQFSCFLFSSFLRDYEIVAI